MRERHDRFVFSAWQAVPRVMARMHTHTDVELNFFLTGGGRYFLAGRTCEIPAGHLAVFWGGTPHRMLSIEPGTEYLVMTLPLGIFLSWRLPTLFTNQLLAGALLLDANDAETTRRLFLRWAKDLRGGMANAEIRRIVLLETEACLRRAAFSHTEKVLAVEPMPETESRHVERIAAFLGENYQQEGLHAADVACAVGLTPNYAITVFQRGCGLGIGGYLTRLRVSHAQRLLLTTEDTGDTIARDCGFGSASRFYAAFRKHTGMTPRAYRRHGLDDLPM